jgi:hypothetical protein
MELKSVIKKIWFSLFDPGRIVLLDYKIDPRRIYHENNPHASLYELINKNRSAYGKILEKAIDYAPVFAAIRENKDLIDKKEPGWNNQYLPGLDIIMLYTLVALLRPKKYIEVGSGVSTKVAYKSRKDNSLDFEIVTIDPSQRTDISGVSDKHYKQQVQQTDITIFTSLVENDIIFFDGTHTLFPNSDVMWFFLEILPRLHKGVIVHIHDIYWPYDYPDFMCDRFYNEQYLLGALLLNNLDKYDIICPNYFISTDKQLSAVIQPVFMQGGLEGVERHGGSFWIRVNS